MRFLLVLAMLFVTSSAFGKNRCFCCYQPVYYPPVEKIVENLEVINRVVSMSPAQIAKPNPLLDQALEQQWLAITAEIPIPPRPQPLRKFEFVKNWPQARPQAVQQAQQIQTETVTRTLYGVVRQNIVVQDGVVTLDASQNVIRALTNP